MREIIERLERERGHSEEFATEAIVNQDRMLVEFHAGRIDALYTAIDLLREALGD